MKAYLALAAGLTVALCSANLAHASDIIPPKAYATTPGGLNVADGSFAYSVTDLSVGPLTLERFYRSAVSQPNDPPFGRNFSSNFDIYYAANPVPIASSNHYPIIHIGQSASGVFAKSGSTFLPNNDDAKKGKLATVGGKYEYMDSAGTRYTFSATVQAVGMPASSQSRKIERIDFPDGRRQAFSYNSSRYLKLVEDSSGYAMVFDYNSSGDITAACAFNRAQNYVSATSTCAGAQLKTTYTYVTLGGQKYLATATDVLGRITNYTMSLTGMTCVKPPGFTSCQVSMTISGGRISNQTLLDGGTWYVSGDHPDVVNNPDTPPAGDGSNEATMIDPIGKVTWVNFTKSSPYSMMDPLGRWTQFRFSGAVQYNNPYPDATTDGTFLDQATYSEGNQYLAEYNGPFRAITKETLVPKPGSGQSSLSKTYGYGSCTLSPGSYQNCAKPLWVKDPNGNQTDYTYELHGGVKSEMQPAPTPNAPRPLILHSYVQKYAYIKNSGGSLVTAATPIWMVASDTSCQTVEGSSIATCDPSKRQTVTSYEYGANGTANNLRVRGVVTSWNGTSLRTCFGYDNQGNKIWETSPRAGLGSCP